MMSWKGACSLYMWLCTNNICGKDPAPWNQQSSSKTLSFLTQLKTTMFSAALKSPTGRASIRYRRGMIAFTVMLFLSVTYAHSTTVEHDLHIVHNVDNRSPEIDPFWYVGRGVRPIGRFGKRVIDSGNIGGLRPVLSSLEFLLTALREKENLRSTLAQEEPEWLP